MISSCQCTSVSCIPWNMRQRHETLSWSALQWQWELTVHHSKLLDQCFLGFSQPFCFCLPLNKNILCEKYTYRLDFVLTVLSWSSVQCEQRNLHRDPLLWWYLYWPQCQWSCPRSTWLHKHQPAMIARHVMCYTCTCNTFIPMSWQHREWPLLILKIWQWEQLLSNWHKPVLAQGSLLILLLSPKKAWLDCNI